MHIFGVLMTLLTTLGIALVLISSHRHTIYTAENEPSLPIPVPLAGNSSRSLNSSIETYTPEKTTYANAYDNGILLRRKRNDIDIFMEKTCGCDVDGDRSVINPYHESISHYERTIINNPEINRIGIPLYLVSKRAKISDSEIFNVFNKNIRGMDGIEIDKEKILKYAKTSYRMLKYLNFRLKDYMHYLLYFYDCSTVPAMLFDRISRMRIDIYKLALYRDTELSVIQGDIERRITEVENKQGEILREDRHRYIKFSLNIAQTAKDFIDNLILILHSNEIPGCYLDINGVDCILPSLKDIQKLFESLIPKLSVYEDSSTTATYKTISILLHDLKNLIHYVRLGMCSYSTLVNEIINMFYFSHPQIKYQCTLLYMLLQNEGIRLKESIKVAEDIEEYVHVVE